MEIFNSLVDDLKTYDDDIIDYKEIKLKYNLRDDQCFHYFLKGKNKYEWCNNSINKESRRTCCSDHIGKNKSLWNLVNKKVKYIDLGKTILVKGKRNKK